MELSFHSLFNSTLDGVERTASNSIRFIPDTESALPPEKGPRTSLEFSSGEKSLPVAGNKPKILNHRAISLVNIQTKLRDLYKWSDVISSLISMGKSPSPPKKFYFGKIKKLLFFFLLLHRAF